MAASFITTISQLYQVWRKPMATTALVLAPDGDLTSIASTWPAWSSGAGLPTELAPNGSMYTRTDASTGDDAVYVRVVAAWVPILGAT